MISSETRVNRMVKITRLPPAPQTVFFQEHQFDEELGEGVDPTHYEKFGSHLGTKANRKPHGNPSAAKKKKLKKAEQALEGHENKEAILKILKSEG